MTLKKQLGIQPQTVSEMQPLQSQLLQDLPELENSQSSLRIARTLRNYVHQNTKIGNGSYSLPLTPQVVMKWKKGEIPLVCSGMTSFYSNMLEVMGIEFRLVDTFLKNDPDPKYDGHSFLEVKTESGWIIQDPTFNIEWHSEGTPIGTRRLRELIKKGKIPQHQLATTNSFKVKKSRSLENYHHTMNDLLNFVEVRSHRFYNRQKGITLVEIYPHSISRKYERLKDPLTFIENETNREQFSEAFSEKNLVLKNAKKLSWERSTAHLTTNDICYDMQMGLIIELEKPASKCTLLFDMIVKKGGINIGLIVNKKVLHSLNYWNSQYKDCGEHCPSKFELSSKNPFEKIEMTFLNWNENQDKTSEWTIHSIKYKCY